MDDGSNEGKVNEALDKVNSTWKFFKKMHQAAGHDERGTQTTLTGPMVGKALKQAKMFENSSKTSETNAGSLKYSKIGGGVQTTSNKLEDQMGERVINIETRTCLLYTSPSPRDA